MQGEKVEREGGEIKQREKVMGKNSKKKQRESGEKVIRQSVMEKQIEQVERKL